MTTRTNRTAAGRLAGRLICAAALCLARAAVAAAQSVVPLWADHLQTYRQRQAELHVFKAPHPATGMSVIICPGGSYYWLDFRNEGTAVARWLNAQGVTAFVLRYRTARRGSHHPAMIQDLQRAIQVVREQAAGFGVAPDKLGIMGFSAGGHLAGTAATYFDTSFIAPLGVASRVSLRPAFVAMIYPVVSMANDTIVHRKSRRNLLGRAYTPEDARRYSLERNVRPDMPPVFLLHCTGDRTVDYRNSVDYDRALAAKGIEHKLMLCNESGHGGHGFGIQPNGATTGWEKVFLQWALSIVNSD